MNFITFDCVDCFSPAGFAMTILLSTSQFAMAKKKKKGVTRKASNRVEKIN